LSRILRGFTRGGVIARSPATDDARKTILRLTARGRRVIAPLEAKARAEVGALLGQIPAQLQGEVVDAMGTIARTLAGSSAAPKKITLRSHRLGDMGWVVERLGALYWREYGWGGTVEADGAGVCGKFGHH